MTKFIYVLPVFALAACATPQITTCDLPNEPMVISYTKSGFPIYDDQAPLYGPCPTVTPPSVSQPPVSVPPVEPPEPPVTPPTPKPEKVKSNSGRGNGSEGDSDQDPGNSGGHNRGGD